MRNMYLVPFLSSLVLIFSALGCLKKEHSKELSLEKTLIIGSESGDQRYVFTDIRHVALDSEGNIYVLDRGSYRIIEFDPKGNYLRSVEIRKGQGPEEVSLILGIAVTDKGKIFALDGNKIKILVFDEGGNFVESFKIGFQAINVIPYFDENVVVLGLNNGHIFHVFSPQGKFLGSFGEPLEVPSRYSQYKSLPQVLLPRRADRSTYGNIFLVSPYNYEIRIYRGEKLKKLVEHKSEFFAPLQIKPADEGRFSMVYPWVSVLEHEDTIFVCIDKLMPGVSNQIDIFKNYKYFGSLRVNGFASAIDRKGCLYFIEKEEFPRIIKYSLGEKEKNWGAIFVTTNY
jgi:hypothetical protein